MNAYYNWLNSLQNKTKSEFAHCTDLKWLNPYAAEEVQYQRGRLLKNNQQIRFKNTKPFYSEISKGCQICGAGKWSCLFITNQCNANCFYCPAKQDEDEVPSTQGLDFDSPADYASYINRFGFKGVSFSGGEPLLYFKRTLEYLKEVRKSCDPDLYIWMYTNGILADKEKLQKLGEAGLNEIRFDIGATGYQLEKLKMAVGIIPVVTIEIPAIPEELETLKTLLPEMANIGVQFLNLHQLRLTPHNVAKLSTKGYTIIPSERPIVLESELAALELIDFARENNIEIGINYCSFHFKNRFQKAGFREIIAKTVKPEAEITSNGYIREFSEDSILYKSIKLFRSKVELPHIHTIEIEGKEWYYIENIHFKRNQLKSEEVDEIRNLLLKEPKDIPSDPLLFKIWQMEYLEEGLREY